MFSPALDTTAVEAIVSKVGSYTVESLSDSELRAQHKQKCAERLQMSDLRGRTVHYADQAILANLDWGIDSLEEAITTNNDETKIARLDHAEKMLQVAHCSTAGLSLQASRILTSQLGRTSTSLSSGSSATMTAKLRATCWRCFS